MAWRSRQHLSANDLWSMVPVYAREIEDNSGFFAENKAKSLSTFKVSELNLGHKLGEGSFCVINEINSIIPEDKSHCNKTHNRDTDGKDATTEMKLSNDVLDDQTYTTFGGMTNATESSLSISRCHARDAPKNPGRYVIKRLNKDLTSKQCARAVIDLFIEMKILSAISHKNIIKLRGMAEGDPTHEGFFLVMDRLYMTLTEKIQQWKNQVRGRKGIFNLGQCGSKRIDLNRILQERAEVSYNLSSAFEYLHKKKIIYRDIKPENIGFDERGIVKVFDFGLCKELRPKDLASSSPSEQFYDITPYVGTCVYMAPEVLLGKPYNFSADVYSFGILLYYIFALKRPFKYLNSGDFADIVANGGKRPKLPSDLHDKLKVLIMKCWSSQISRRPEFSFIKSELSELLSDLYFKI